MHCSGIIGFRILSVIVLAICIEWLGSQQLVRAETEEDTLAEIRIAWLRRYKATRNVRCIVSGSRLTPKDQYGGTEDHKTKLGRTWILDPQRNRFRIEHRSDLFRTDKRKWYPDWDDIVLDGQNIKHHQAGITATRKEWAEQQPEFHIHPKNYQFFEIFDCPIFLSLGVRPAYGTESDSTMKRPLHSDTYKLHGQGTIDGRKCDILRTVPQQPRVRTDEYWVDLERDAAILRWRQFRNPEGIVDIECDIDYQKTPHGWNPAKFRTVCFGSNGKLVQENTVTVSAFSMNEELDEGLFRLEPKPGMYVIDEAKRRLQLVAADGNLVDAPILNGPAASTLTGLPAPELSGKVWLSAKGPLKWKDLRGKPVLLILFDLRQPSFVPLVPAILTYEDSYGKDGLTVIGVHQNCPRDEVAKRLADERITFPVLIDDGKTGPRFVHGYSSSFLIDGEGKVISGYKNLLIPPAEIEKLLDGKK